MKITTKNARITVITDSLVRLEYSAAGVFNDVETLFAVYRGDGTENAEHLRKGEIHRFITDKFELTYIDDGNSFSPDNLYADICGKEWFYGKEDKENLGGTLTTLDYVSPDKKTKDGLLSRNGWHVIDDSGKPVLKNGWITKNPVKENTDIYLFAYGTDYKRALNDLFFVSGKAELPRKYVFGSWYSRWWPYSDEDIKGIVKGYDEHDFPLDIMVIDMDWHYHDWQPSDEDKYRAKYGYGHADNVGWTGYTWNRKLIKNPEKLLGKLHDDSIYVTLNDHPADGIRTNEEWYGGFCELMGIPAQSGINLEFDCGDKRYMENLFKSVHSNLEKQGVDFWWVDWQQDEIKPYVKGINGLRHIPWLNKCYYEHSKQNGKRGISFSRWGGWGDHKYPVYFSGDTKSTWDILEYEIKFTVSSSNSGCFYWGHDTGGFYGERDWEMYVRWTQFTAFSACLRVHSQRDETLDRRPWLWGKTAEDAMRKVYHMRSALIPYIYSSAYNCYENNVPLIKGMYMDFPEEDNAYKFPVQYMLGDAFIIAPVTEPGIGANKEVTKNVWIYGGDYYNIFTGQKYNNGTIAGITSKIDEFPALVKGGVPIPMQQYQKRMTSASLNTLVIRVYPGTYGEFTLYEDDGISEDFKNGRYLKTKLTYQKSAENIRITIEPFGTGYDGMPKQRNYIVELPLEDNIIIKNGVGEIIAGKISVNNKNIMDTVTIELEKING